LSDSCRSLLPAARVGILLSGLRWYCEWDGRKSQGMVPCLIMALCNAFGVTGWVSESHTDCSFLCRVTMVTWCVVMSVGIVPIPRDRTPSGWCWFCSLQKVTDSTAARQTRNLTPAQHKSDTCTTQIWHLHNTRGEIGVLYTLTLKFLDRKLEGKRFCTYWW
jgi:hypothetical protein